jgi:hypothetical protein
MNIKTSSLVALLSLAAAPLTSPASDTASNAAFDACIKAFTTTYVPNHRVRDTRTNDSATLLDYWKPSSYTIEVRARGVKSGKTLAEARCLVDHKGVVVIQDAAAPNYAVSVDATPATP